MIQATCIQKFKKNNKIYGYRLQDAQGNTMNVYADQLKTAIANKQIEIINLTLTSDNRLVDTSEQQPQPESEEQQLKNYIAKCQLIGIQLKIIEIPTFCGHHCTLISESETQHIIYIPDNVTQLNDRARLVFTDQIMKLKGAIKVIGGHSLKTANSMFASCKAQYIDLSNFDTSKVIDMSFMFVRCKAQVIELSSFNTSKVEDMHGMFSLCLVESLDLSSFDTSNVVNMHSMFEYCQAQSINLSSFNTSRVRSMGKMFFECQAQTFDFSSFDTRNVKDMYAMFYECKSQSIDLSSFSISSETETKSMFKYCKSQIKTTDPKILAAYNNKEEK